MEDSFKHFQPKKSLDKLEKSLAGVDLKVGRKDKSPEEVQGEAMEAFIERTPVEEKVASVNVAEEKLDSQGEAMEAFIKNGVEISGKKEIGNDSVGSEDAAEERAENTPDKNEEVVFEEVFEDESEKRSELEELQAAVARARMGYASKDYEVTNVFAKIRKIFGGNLRSTPGNHPETHDQYNAYKIALTELLDYQVAQLKEKKLPSEELISEIEKLTKYYNQDEKINLYAARTDTLAADWEKKFGKPLGWIAKYGGKFVNGYRKLNWKTKMALGVGAALSGAGLLIAGQRMLGGAAAGVGVTAVLEARYRQKEEERLAEEQANIKNELEKITDPEEKYAVLTARMQKEMEGYQKSLKTEKSKAIWRKVAGVGVAAFIGTGVASHLFKWLGHTAYDHLSNHTADKLPHGGLTSSHGRLNTPPVGDNNFHPGEPLKSSGSGLPSNNGPEVVPNPGSGMPDVAIHHEIVGAPNIADKAAEHISSPNVSSVEIADKTKNSVWKMAADQLEKHFGSNVSGLDSEHAKMFADFGPEQKTYLINALKNKIAEHHADFKLDNIDRIKIGQKIDFSKIFEDKADIAKIFEHADKLTKAQIENIAHNNATISHWVENHSGHALTSPKVEEILSQAQNHAPVVPENILHETPAAAAPNGPVPFQISHPDEAVMADSAGAISPIAGVGLAAAGIKVMKEKPAAKNNVVKFPDAAERMVREEEKAAQKPAIEFEKMIKEYKLVPSEEPSARAMKLIKAVAINSKENWNLMKGAKFPEWKKGVPVELVTEQGKKLTPKLTKNIRKLVTDMMDYSGNKMQPKANETLFAWVARVAKNSLQAEKVEDLQKAA